MALRVAVNKDQIIGELYCRVVALEAEIVRLMEIIEARNQPNLEVSEGGNPMVP